jgi:hypothetical protein
MLPLPKLLRVSSSPAAARETAAQRKETKYAEIVQNIYLLSSIAFETLGPINCAGQWAVGTNHALVRNRSFNDHHIPLQTSVSEWIPFLTREL